MRKFKKGDRVISSLTVSVHWQQKGWMGEVVDDDLHHFRVKWTDERCEYKMSFLIDPDTIKLHLEYLFEEDV